MRRDYVTLDVDHVDPDRDQLPTVTLTVDERADLLGERLVAVDGERLGGDQIDVGFRLTTAVDDEEASGVFSISNRVTGEYVLEVNTDAPPVLDLVSIARDTDDPDGSDGCYRIVVQQDGEDVAVYEKRTLLVYDGDGSLLRQHSLIPSGVEL